MTYRSLALWQHGAFNLHQRFLDWAASVGLHSYSHERLSRVDFTFDYRLETLDFDEDHFVSQSVKDNQHRKIESINCCKSGGG